MLQKIKHESFYHKIARKFYDSLLLFWARKGNEKNLPIVYVLIIEHPILDKKLRRQLKLKIEKQLPFRLDDPLIEKQVISSFEGMGGTFSTGNYKWSPMKGEPGSRGDQRNRLSKFGFSTFAEL